MTKTFGIIGSLQKGDYQSLWLLTLPVPKLFEALTTFKIEGQW